MIINNELFDSLLAQAAESPRLRRNYDLRTSPEDSSQRMLNALLPGTEVPVHRHRFSTECVFILRGRAEEVLYDEDGAEIARYVLSTSPSGAPGCVIPVGVWHTIVATEPSVIFEAKDGPFVPASPEDVKVV